MNYELRIKNYKKILFFCFFVFLFFIFWNIYIHKSLAAESLVSGVDCSKTENANNSYCTGNYELNDFVKIAITVAAWILGITGSLALLFFIYGGFMFLISAGSSERVQKAKQIIIGAVIGVVIVLTSFLIINFILTSLGADKDKDGKLWYQLK